MAKNDTEDLRVSRRGMLVGALALPALGATARAETGEAPPIDHYMHINRLSDEMATTMALVHGGDWQVIVDHDLPMVLVRRAVQPTHS